ncbi:hypothetical protein HMN09_00929600 [Mycena chlorophos]|uniref:Uncharacterized protein n=1 Tax=Mycena chlorophos TaxID=658473 RepID=A0A8H6SKD3_MYCCL|nr:hypothetical protein HMN09_00929600 [Mycena chlorophos]
MANCRLHQNHPPTPGLDPLTPSRVALSFVGRDTYTECVRRNPQQTRDRLRIVWFAPAKQPPIGRSASVANCQPLPRRRGRLRLIPLVAPVASYLRQTFRRAVSSSTTTSTPPFRTTHIDLHPQPSQCSANRYPTILLVRIAQRIHRGIHPPHATMHRFPLLQSAGCGTAGLPSMPGDEAACVGADIDIGERERVVCIRRSPSGIHLAIVLKSCASGGPVFRVGCSGDVARYGGRVAAVWPPDCKEQRGGTVLTPRRSSAPARSSYTPRRLPRLLPTGSRAPASLPDAYLLRYSPSYGFFARSLEVFVPSPTHFSLSVAGCHSLLRRAVSACQLPPHTCGLLILRYFSLYTSPSFSCLPLRTFTDSLLYRTVYLPFGIPSSFHGPSPLPTSFPSHPPCRCCIL